MTFQREDISGIISEIGKLAQEHFKEVGQVYGFPLRPDFETYQALERAEALRIFTARNDNSELVGYQIFYISTHLFLKAKVALQNLLYFSPNERRHALNFMRFCDEKLKEGGVDMVRQYVTKSKDFSPVLKRLGYEEVERVFMRRLDG